MRKIIPELLLASVVLLDACLTGYQEIIGLIPARFWQCSFVEIDHKIISTVILLLIQEGQLSVFGEGTCTSTGKLFRGLSLPRKSVN